MNKKLILSAIFSLALISNAFAGDVSSAHTYINGEVLTAELLNASFDEIITEVNDLDADNLASDIAIVTTGICRFDNKIAFTQADNLEYIDSLADGYLDAEATTGFRMRINATEQINLVDGILQPTTDNDIDLGAAAKEYKDLYIDGTANIDSLVADTADLNGGTLGPMTLDGKLTAGATEIEGSAFDIDGGDISAVTVSGGLTWSAAQDLDNQNLTNMDADSGTMDGVNIGTTTATGELIVNDASDDANGLGDQGTVGQVLTSAGAGADPIWEGPAMSLVTRTVMAASTSSNQIYITQGVHYYVVAQIQAQGATDVVAFLRFNLDGGNTYGNSGEAKGASTEINIYTCEGNNNEGGGSIRFNMSPIITDQMVVYGDATYIDASNNIARAEIVGHWNNNAAVTNFSIGSSGGGIDGEILLYKMNEQ